MNALFRFLEQHPANFLQFEKIIEVIGTKQTLQNNAFQIIEAINKASLNYINYIDSRPPHQRIKYPNFKTMYDLNLFVDTMCIMTGYCNNCEGVKKLISLSSTKGCTLNNVDNILYLFNKVM